MVTSEPDRPFSADEISDILSRQKRPILNPINVPIELHHLIELAQTWAIRDEAVCAMLLKQSSDDSIMELIRAVEDHRLPLHEWLGKEHAEPQYYTDEYYAFSYFAIAADLATAILKWKK